MNQKLYFRLTGGRKIHCAGCERVISAALVRVLGVEKAWASAQSQRIGVILDGARVTPDEVAWKLEDLGYQAKLLEAEVIGG